MIIPSGIIIMYIGSHSSISGLSGWSRNTDFDSKYVKGTAASTNPGNRTGGTATHTHPTTNHTHGQPASHTHAGTSGQGDDLGYPGNTYNGGWNVPARTHTHSFTSGTGQAGAAPAGAGSWGTATSDPSRYSVIFLESDGNAIDFPDDAVTYLFAASNSGDIPTGFSHHTASVGKFLLGAATGAEAGSVDASGASHVHTPASHGHGSAGAHDHAQSNTSSMSPAYPYTGVWWYDHGHDGVHGGWWGSFTVSGHTADTTSSGSVTVGSRTGGNSGGNTATPPYRKLTAIVNDSGSAKYEEGLIVLWDGNLSAIPLDWTLCDGSDGTPDMRDKFPLNTTANEAVNGTGGAVGHPDHGGPGTHDHTASHSHTFTFSFHGSGHYAGHLTPGQPSGTLGPIVGWAKASNNDKGHYSVSVGGGPAVGAIAENISSVSDSQPPFRYVAFLSSPASESGQIGMFGSNF